METAVIGDTTTRSSGPGDWLRRAVLAAAVLFVLLLAYVLVVTLLSSGDDEPPPPGTGDSGVDDGVMTAAVEAPGDRPFAIFGLDANAIEHVDVRCLLPTRFTPMVVELTNAASTATTIDVHLLIVDGTGQAFETVAAAANLRPGEVREVLPRVKATQPVVLVGGVSRCDILAMQQGWRVVRYGTIGPDSR